MRRLTSTTSLVFLLTASLIGNVSAATIPNTSCPKIGLHKKVGNKKFTCLKIGAKYKWDIDKTASKQASSNTLKDSDFPEVTFKNLPESSKGISFWSWKRSSIKISSTVSMNPRIQVFKSPNSSRITHNPETTISLVSKMFSDFPQVDEFIIVYYSFKDIDWAQKYIDQYIGKDGGYDTSDEAKRMCPSEFNCAGASILTNRKTGLSLTIITTPNGLSSISNFGTGVIEAHEYSHSVQDKQIIGRKMADMVPPRWLTEGSAEYIQIASVYSNSYSDYLRDRKQIIKDLHFPSNVNKSWLNDFLNPPDIGFSEKNWDNYDSWRVYDVGFLVSEILVSIAGPNSIMDLFKSMGDGLTFQNAFEKVYGITWNEGLNSLIDAIVPELSN